MLKATNTVKNIKHLQEITQKIIDNYHNDELQCYQKKDPSLKQELQQMNKRMDAMKDKVEKIEQGAIHGKFFYKNHTLFAPQAVLDRLEKTNQVVTKAIDHIQKIFPNTLDFLGTYKKN